MTCDRVPGQQPAERRSSGDLVRSYFASCNGAPAEVIAAHFTEDAVIYDTNHAPVVGAEAIGRFWCDVRARWSRARWTVDVLVESPEAVAVEWTMHGQRRGTSFAAHGSDHFDVREGRIAQVRQYWVLDTSRPGTGLVGHPDRGPSADTRDG